MERQPEAPAFCACPPSCLELLRDEKADLEKVQRIYSDEARELQSRLKEQLSQVWTELGLFLRLMYKNKNQHRRSLYYRRLSEVRRDLQLLSTSGLEETVECVTKFEFFTEKRPDAVSSKAATRSKPRDAINEIKVLRTLLGAARLLNQSNGQILAGSVHLAGLLGQSFFMPFALTMISCLARFRVLLSQVLYEVVTAFNLLSAAWQLKQKTLTTYAQWNSVPATFVDRSLPVQLECRWDGMNLCMTEQKPAGILESRGPDSDVLAEQTPLFFVDDRTGVKYDLGVPAPIARSATEELRVNLETTSNANNGTTMGQGVERMANSELDFEELVPCLSRLHSKEDITEPSGEHFTATIETNNQTEDLGAFNLASNLPVMPAMVRSGVVDSAELRMANSELDFEELVPCLSRLHSKEDITEPSGEHFTATIETNNQTEDLGAFNLASNLPVMPAMVRSGVVDSAELRDPGGQGSDSFTTNTNHRPDSGTSGAVKKNVAYISISHKFAQGSATKGNIAQSLQGDARGDGAYTGIKQEVRDRALKVSGSEDDPRNSDDRGKDSLPCTGLIGDNAHGVPSSLSLSQNFRSIEMVESDTSKLQLEKVGPKQGISTLLDSSDRTDQAVSCQDDLVKGAAAVGRIRPLVEVDANDTLNTTVESMTGMEDSVQMASSNVTTALNFDTRNGDVDLAVADVLRVGSIMTSEQDDINGDRSPATKDSKVKEATAESSEDGVAYQNRSSELVVNRPVNIPLDEKAVHPVVLSTDAKVANIFNHRLPGKVQLESPPNQARDNVMDETLISKDLQSTGLERPLANVSVISNPMLSVVDAGFGPPVVHIEEGMCYKTTESCNAVGSSKMSMKDISLKKSVAYISVNPGLKSRTNWKEEKPVLIEDPSEAGPNIIMDVPKKMESEQTAEQSLGNNVETTTANKAPTVKRGLKRPVAYISVGSNVKTPQKKKRRKDAKRKRTEENVASDRKQPLPIEVKVASPAKAEARRGNVDSIDRDSKKKKANDIFAMLLGGTD